jgi:hypothetical protein
MKYLTDKTLSHRCDLDDWNFAANKTHMFIPTDSIDLWETHIETHIKKEKYNHSIQYYRDNPIEYKLNNAGFRTPDDFNSEDVGNVFLGCSHTFGIGHHLKNTWSYKLNNIIGGKFWNLSLGGTGVATHFRILLAHYKKLKIKNIFHFAPMYPRYEFIENGRPQYYIIADYNKDWWSKFGSLMPDSLLTNEQCEFNWISYTYAIKALANEIGCNYYLIEGDTDWHGRDDNSLLARDLLHHTTKVQHSIYQDFLKLYDEDLYEKYANTQEPILDIKKYIKDTKTNII